MVWAPDYVTLAETKSFLRITDTADDAELAFAITAASRAIDHAASRQFGLTGSAVARLYTAYWDRWRRRYVIEMDDLMTTTDLVIKFDSDDDEVFDQTLAAGDRRLYPFNADENSRPWLRIIVDTNAVVTPTLREGAVEVTANWGWSAVPATVKQAALLQASRFFVRRNSPYGIAGSADIGSELRLMSKVDPDVELALRPYRRVWGAA